MSSTDHTPTTPEAEDDIIEGQAEVKDPKQSASHSTASEQAAPRQGQTGGRLGRWLAGLCAVMALLLAGYTSWQFYELSSYDDAEKAHYEAELSAVKAELTSLSQRYIDYDAALARTQSEITELRQQIERLAEKGAANAPSERDGLSAEALMLIMLTERLHAGQDISHFASLISAMPALSYQSELEDILTLAGQSSHHKLQQEAKELWDITEQPAKDTTPLSSISGWFADLVKLQPVEGTSHKADVAEPLVPFDPDLSLSALMTLISDQDTEQAALWLVKARARIEAETKAQLLMQAIMLSQQEDAS